MWEQETDRQTDRKKVNSQLALVSFDPFGGAKAFSSYHLAHIRMAITFAGWKEQKNAYGEKTGKREKQIFNKGLLQYFVEQS